MKKTLVDLFEESVKLYPNNTFLLEKKDKKEVRPSWRIGDEKAIDKRL